MDEWTEVKKMTICELIDSKASDRTTLRLAATNEIANRRFVCEPCRREFKYLSHYKIHIRGKGHIYTIKPPDWKCSTCNRKFEYKSRYERHMNSHKNEHLKPNLICEKCGTTTRSKSEFNKHLATKKHLKQCLPQVSV